MKFRKKPVVIEAVQFTEEDVKQYLWQDVPLPDGCLLVAASHHPGDRKLYRYTVVIETLEGQMKVSDGDWVITGVKGERYPCKPDIFAATYEQVER